MRLDPKRQALVLERIKDDERAAEFHEREAKRLRASAAARRKSWDLSDASHTTSVDSDPETE